MDTSDIVWIIVAVLVLLALAALIAAVMRKKKAAQTVKAREHAQHLRTEAAARSGDLQESRIEAQEAELRAERARVEAQKEHERAEQVRQAHLAEQARVEDTLREADRLDPDVDHRSDGYTPTTPQPGAFGTAGHHTTGDATTGQGHQEVVHETHTETVYENDPNDPSSGSGGSSRAR